MPGTLLFVHGTGNWAGRRPGDPDPIDGILSCAEHGLGTNGLRDVDVVAARWAKACAPSWPDVRLSLPVRSVRSAADAEGGPGQVGDELWDVLIHDPVAELRLWALMEQLPPTAQAPTMVPGVIRRDADIVEVTRTVTLAPATLGSAGLGAGEMTRAAQAIAECPELAAVARAVAAAQVPNVLDAVARAVVAQILWSSRAAASMPPRIALSGEDREAVVAEVREGLSDVPYRGILPAPARQALVALATRVGTAWAVPRRGTLMDPITTFAADITYYLRHGQEVRDFLADRILGLRPPVVVVGHSLGGVAAVDLLSGRQQPAVALLVTIGSQAPYLYLTDSMEYLRPASSSVSPFLPWLNIYDVKDLLSFCAERVFPGIKGIHDVAVDARVPFPESHSAYWEHALTWSAIAEAWPRE